MSLEKLPLVSIIMPAYNAEKYIEESIASVQNQTITDWELIIIDDGSTDLTSNIVKLIQKKDKRIKYIYQSNKKLPAARNTGIRISNGEYIAFLDSDDLWMPEKLAIQLQVIVEKKCDLVFTGGYILQEENQQLMPYPAKFGFYKGDEMYNLEYFANYIPVLSVILKRECFEKFGFKDESLVFGCEDWDYWLRMARGGATFYGMPDKLFKYRVHEGGMSRKVAQMKLAEFTALYKNIDYSLLSEKDTFLRLSRLMEENVPQLVQANLISFAKEEILKILKLKFQYRYFLAMVALYIPIKKIHSNINYIFYPSKIILKIKSMLNDI